MVGRPDIEAKARSTLVKKEARKKEDTRKSIWYRVRGYNIRFKKETEEWSCECKWWSVMDEVCHHIFACMMLKEGLNWQSKLTDRLSIILKERSVRSTETRTIPTETKTPL